MKRKDKHLQFPKLGEGNAKGPAVEVEIPNGDFLMFYLEPFEGVVLGDAITIDTDPQSENFAEVTEVDFFFEVIPSRRPYPPENFEIQIGGHKINLKVIDT
jgi:hypothetical protein